MEEIITEILNRINKARIESFTSKTRNSATYRIGLTKAIEIIYDIKLERSEGKETPDELPPSNCIKPAVSNSFCNCPSLKEELHYGYCVPVCFKCNKVVQLQND